MMFPPTFGFVIVEKISPELLFFRYILVGSKFNVRFQGVFKLDWTQQDGTERVSDLSSTFTQKWII